MLGFDTQIRSVFTQASNEICASEKVSESIRIHKQRIIT